MRKIKILLLTIIFTFSSVLVLNSQEGVKTNLKVGIAKVDITPPIGTPLGGYAARGGTPSTGIHDPVESRAVVLDNGIEKIAIVGVDILLVEPKMMSLIRDKVSKEIKIKKDRIFICATHTHSGPGAYWPKGKIVLGPFNPKIREMLVKGISESIIYAHKNLKPALIGGGIGYVRGASINRTDTYKPGRKYGPDGITDYEVGVIRIDDLNGNIMAVIINFATHPTVLTDKNLLISSDFPYYLRNSLERAGDNKFLSIYINGAQGDQAPKEVPHLSDFNQAERVGNIIAEEGWKVLQDIKTEGKVEIKISSLNFEIPNLGKSEMNAVAINDIVITTIPGELFSLVGQEIKKKAKNYGFKYPFIFGLCNDYVGYILTEEAYNHSPIEYERTFCFTGPHGGEYILKFAEKLIKEVSKVK